VMPLTTLRATGMGHFSSMVRTVWDHPSPSTL
jgi:hypothetical protein